MISDRGLFAIRDKYGCALRFAPSRLRLDCVILLSNSINRAPADLDVAAYERSHPFSRSTSWKDIRHGNRRACRFLCLPFKSAKTIVGGQGTPVWRALIGRFPIIQVLQPSDDNILHDFESDVAFN